MPFVPNIMLSKSFQYSPKSLLNGDVLVALLSLNTEENGNRVVWEADAHFWMLKLSKHLQFHNKFLFSCATAF